jgi:hypothetical protein
MRVALRIFSCISCRRGFVMLRITRKKIYIMPHSAQMENLFSKIRLLVACKLSWALWIKEGALQTWKQGLASFNNREFHLCRFARSYNQICLSDTYYHFQRCNKKSDDSVDNKTRLWWWQKTQRNKQQTLNQGPTMIDIMTSLYVYQCCACKSFGTYILCKCKNKYIYIILCDPIKQCVYIYIWFYMTM